MTDHVDPSTPDEWQDAVDGAHFWSLVEAARSYGLVSGGPVVDVARCDEILANGRIRGYEPHAPTLMRIPLIP